MTIKNVCFHKQTIKMKAEYRLRIVKYGIAIIVLFENNSWQIIKTTETKVFKGEILLTK